MRLVIGDVAVYLVATLIGFASHDLLAGEHLLRMLATFFPFCLAWILYATLGGAYDSERLKGSARVLRPILIAVLAAPGGSLLRGLLLNTTIQTTFVLVMAGVTALGIGLWRGLDMYLVRRRDNIPNPGIKD
jgi:hypothetical protein